MEKVAEVLKVFLEKYLIPTVVAVAASILIVAIFPGFLGIALRVGQLLYGVLAFCVFFLLVLFFCWLVDLHKKIKTNNLAKVSNQQYIEKTSKEAMERLWRYVDKLSPLDRKYLMDFLKNDNAPIIQKGSISGDCLFNSEFVVVTKVVSEEQERVSVSRQTNNDGHIRIPIEQIIYSPSAKKYKLNDEFFQLLKYSYQKFNRISHFEE